MSAPRDDGFCSLCGVTLDLHDGPDSCDHADAKATVLAMFSAPFWGGR